MPSLDKTVAYTTIIGGLCTPLMLFFAAAAFFQWTPSTFKGLGIVSTPVGIAVIALILGVCPWAALGYAYFRSQQPVLAPVSIQPPLLQAASARAPKQTSSEMQYRPTTGNEVLKFMESLKVVEI